MLNYFQKINLVDGVYRLVDSAQSRFTVVSRWHSCEGLLERGSPSLQSLGACRRWGKRRRALRWSSPAAPTGSRGAEMGRQWSGASDGGEASVRRHLEVSRSGTGVRWGVAENGRGGGTFYRASEGAERTEWRWSPAVSAHSRQQFSKMEWGKRRWSDVILMANLKGGGDLAL
jgi:hypothetical protein